HVDDIELVVHVDPPTEHKAYLHRSGRTARAGKEGVVATLVLPEQQRDVTQMMRKAGITAALEPVTASSQTVLELIGTRAEPVAPPAESRTAAPPAARRRRGRPEGRTNAQPRRRDGGAAAAASPAPGRTVSGRATIGHMPSGGASRGARRASSPQQSAGR